MKDTDKYTYALLEVMRLMAKHAATGNICVWITFASTFDVFSDGSKFVVRLSTCVRMVAKSMCQLVRNIGNGKFRDDSTALLNKICHRKHSAE